MTANLYNLSLFLHVLGAAGFFVALSLEWTSLRRMRRAVDVEELEPWVSTLKGLERVGPTSTLMLLVTGVYMTVTLRAYLPWVMVSMVALVAMAILGGGVTGRRMEIIGRRFAELRIGWLPTDVRNLLANPILPVSFQLRAALLLAVVFLMTTKPGLGGSLGAIAVAIGIGLVSMRALWPVPATTEM
ncbi:MAG: hypothetical protein GEU90_07695 [Gemmatimonas sp.]|nr:hypothetical protein [Gemmatimonas sp.]